MQHYTLDNHLFILTSRDTLVLVPEEVEVLEREEWATPQMQDSQMLSVFPEALSTIKNLLREFKEEFSRLEAMRPILRDLVTEHIRGVRQQEYCEDLIMKVYIDIPEENLNRKIKRFERMLDWRKFKDDANLERAKSRPISDLIEFNGAGFAKCVWHNEKSPSMKYYPDKNKVHCFGCDMNGDVLDVYMKLYNCTLPEGIRALS